MKDQLSGWRASFYFLRQRFEVDPAGFQFSDQADQVGQISSETIRANCACGYCLIHEADSGYDHQEDHQRRNRSVIEDVKRWRQVEEIYHAALDR